MVSNTNARPAPAGETATSEDFWAGADIDLEIDKSDEAAGRKIKCLLHVLWGGKGTVGDLSDVLPTWREQWGAPGHGRRALDALTTIGSQA